MNRETSLMKLKDSSFQPTRRLADGGGVCAGGVRHGGRGAWYWGSLIPLFTIMFATAPAAADPLISGVSPNRVWNSTTFELTITGSGFIPGANVGLSRPQGPTILATSVVVPSSREIRAVFDLTGAPAGRWNLGVLQINGGDVLFQAVAIRAAPKLERLSSWGGPVQAMEIREREIEGQPRQIGYVARGSGLVILDVTDPTNMTEISSIDLRGVVLNLAMKDNYAFVWTWGTYLNVVDVADVANPRRVVSGISTGRAPGQAGAMAIHGDTAYLISRGGHPWLGRFGGDLMIMDVTDPANLISGQAFMFPSAPGVAFALTVDGDYLYVVFSHQAANSDRILSIYDLSTDPLAPQLLGSTTFFLDTYYTPNAVTVDGDFAYMTTWHRVTGGTVARLAIVNVENPGAPFPIGVFSDLSAATDVTVSSGIAYVADMEWDSDGNAPPRSKGLAIVDVSTDPSNPTLLGSFQTHGAVQGVTVRGSTAYVHDVGEGVIAVDVSDPLNPTRLGVYHSPGDLRRIDKAGDLLFFNDYWVGLNILDVSDPRKPTLVASRRNGPISSFNGDVRLQDGLAYVAAGYNGLQVLDVSNPGTPTLLGSWEEHTAFDGGVAVREEVLVATLGLGQMVVLDVSDPGNPLLASLFGGQNEQNWVMTEDFFAYNANLCCQGSYGFDLSDPYEPVFLNFMQGGGEIAFEGRNLYLSSGPFDVHSAVAFSIYEIHDTGETSFVGQAKEVVASRGVGVQNGRAYVTGADTRTGTWSLLVFDVADLPADGTAPRLAAIPTNGNQSFLVDEPYVYAGGESMASYTLLSRAAAGLVIFQVGQSGSVLPDGDVDLVDFASFQRCFTGPGGSTTGGECPTHDFDEDGDVDGEDFERFRAGMTGQL